MMFARACVFGLLLLSPKLALASSPSFLQFGRGRRGSGDWDDTEVKLCTFGAGDGSDRLVKVFADTSDNTRYVSFAREGFASDDGFIESMVKCKGTLSKSCLNQIPSECVQCSCEPDLSQGPYGNYQARMLKLIVPQCMSHARKPATGQEPFRVLLVGLGGGALAQYVLGQCPRGTVVEAVEYDPRMIEAATRFFGLRPQPGVLEVVQGDGGNIVSARAQKGQTYNAVLVDAYEGGPHVPESCRNAAFVKSLWHILKQNGTVLHNIKVDYEAALPLYKSGFGSSSVRGEDLSGNGELPSHLIIGTKSS